jgi:uncharacterized protein (TIGR00369 family)
VEQFADNIDIINLIPLVINRGHCQLLGMEFNANGPNWCELKMPYDAKLARDFETGIMASGPIFALMDMASGMAIWITRKKFAAHVTLDLRVDYPRPAKPGATIYGRSECYRMTKSVGFVRGLAHDGDPEKPVAHVAGTFMFINAP